MSAVLEVESVSKTFTRTEALAGVSMTIEPGEVHALLGQNGSGKSTLIKILSGYHAPDPGGGIRVEGNELPLESPVQSYRLGCRFVQQDLGSSPRCPSSTTWRSGPAFPRRSERSTERRLTSRPRTTWRSSASKSTRRRSWLRSALGAHRRRHRPLSARRSAVSGVSARPRRADGTFPVDEVDDLLDRVSAMAATGVGVLYIIDHLGEVFGSPIRSRCSGTAGPWG